MTGKSLRGSLGRAARSASKQLVAGAARRLAPEREDLPLSTWGLTRTASGALALDGVDLNELLARHGSPLHVVDARRLDSNAERFSRPASGANLACEVFCSYKTSPVPGILRRMHAKGLGAEVVSAYELWLALQLGVDPAAIVYNGPAKSDESLALALKAGVGLVNVNDRREIGRIAHLARKLGKRPRVGIRVVPPGCLGSQLGERVDTGAALRTFAEALKRDELRVVAIHSHFGGEIASPTELHAFVAGLLSFADELRARLGLAIEILDVGGNLACPTVSAVSSLARRLAVSLGCEPRPRERDSVLTIDDYVARVVRQVESHFKAQHWPVPRLFLEPGRALTSNAQMLLCRAVTVRDRDEIGMHWAVLDVGIHLAEPMTTEWHQLFPICPRPDAPRRLYRLTGPSCMLCDQVYPAWKLPELAAGDGLAIMDTGAYFVAFAAPFSFPRPAIVMVDGGSDRVLRAAETFDDLVALDCEWKRQPERSPTSSAPRAGPAGLPAPGGQPA
jgi:diaminopimelate decarboxylase